MAGRVVHFEVPYDDADRARGFYRDVFGWKIEPVPEFAYNFVQTGPVADNGMPAETGYIGGGQEPGRAILRLLAAYPKRSGSATFFFSLFGDNLGTASKRAFLPLRSLVQKLSSL